MDESQTLWDEPPRLIRSLASTVITSGILALIHLTLLFSSFTDFFNEEVVYYSSGQVCLFGLWILILALQLHVDGAFISAACWRVVYRIQMCSLMSFLLFCCHVFVFGVFTYFVFVADDEDIKAEGRQYLFTIAVLGFLYLFGSLSGFTSIKEIRKYRHQKFDTPLTNEEMEIMDFMVSILEEKLYLAYLMKISRDRNVKMEKDLELQSP